MHKKNAFSLIELSIVILIIGILIAGVTQSSRLVSAMKLATARQITQSSPVSSIPNIAFWLDSVSENSFATGTSTFTNVDTPEDGTAVGRWNDINPQRSAAYRNNFTQGTAANQPLYKINSINSLPALKFDGSNDCIATASTTPAVFSNQLTQEATLFVVQKFIGDASTESTTFSWDGGSLANRFILFAPWVGSVLFDSGNYTNARLTYLSPPTSFYSANNLLTARRKGTNSDLWLNGTSIASRTDAASFMDFSVTAPIEIGGCASVFSGWIGEIIIFDRGLKTEERKAVENYLAKKWGLKIS